MEEKGGKNSEGIWADLNTKTVWNEPKNERKEERKKKLKWDKNSKNEEAANETKLRGRVCNENENRMKWTKKLEKEKYEHEMKRSKKKEKRKKEGILKLTLIIWKILTKQSMKNEPKNEIQIKKYKIEGEKVENPKNENNKDKQA